MHRRERRDRRQLQAGGHLVFRLVTWEGVAFGCIALDRHFRLPAEVRRDLLCACLQPRSSGAQLLLVSAVVLAFLWAATEWTAWRLAFQPQLGPAWFMIGRWPIYQPLAFFIWWFKFDALRAKDLHSGRVANVPHMIRNTCSKSSDQCAVNLDSLPCEP